MKKLILLTSLLTSLLMTQASFASLSESEKVNECFSKMTALTDQLIDSGVETIERNGYADSKYHRSTSFTGIEPSGKSCDVSITQSSYPEEGSDMLAHDDIVVSVTTNSRIHVGFSINTYYDYVISGIPGGPSKVNFKAKRCDVDLNNLNAKVIFSSVGKDTVQITNKGNGIIDFKTTEDASGILGLFTKAYSINCTVDLNKQK